MEKSVLKYSGWLMAAVVAGLLLLHLLPALTVGGHALRRVDILADVRPRPTDAGQSTLEELLPELDTPGPASLAVDTDSTSLSKSRRRYRPPLADTVHTDLTLIEDFADTTARGMEPFYRALDELSRRPRPVRVAAFGDSFIEADILTGDLRAMLQRQYGGCGVGFVPITSKVNAFRPTVRHAFDGWQSYTLIGSTGFDAAKSGISGHYFLAAPGAYVELKGQRAYATLLDTCREATLYFYPKQRARISVSVNEEEAAEETFVPMGGLQQMQVRGSIGSVRFTVQQADSTLFYGVAMDDTTGIVVDNFALRSNSGLSLRGITPRMMREFNALRPYDLILLEYGLNVASEERLDYSGYAAGMEEVVEQLKRAFPQAGILLVGVGDRAYKDEAGELATMPGIKSLVRYQRKIARDTGIAFWNLYEAMGGEGSIVSMVEAAPPLANLDYTHLNFRGGKYIAGLLYEVLQFGKEQYDNWKACVEAEEAKEQEAADEADADAMNSDREEEGADEE
ncbi:MAG: SGNH/GDSL hydrolase family protein [Prevotellaceae bacterium]|nr:SGNH/GDSL hydrolase family protein [Prevotellaceae bacterium]